MQDASTSTVPENLRSEISILKCTILEQAKKISTLEQENKQLRQSLASGGDTLTWPFKKTWFNCSAKSRQNMRDQLRGVLQILL